MESDVYFCGNDLIHRSVYACNLKKIVENCHSFPKSNDNKSYVIGINAPWGTGKTYFVKMFQNYLKGVWADPELNEEKYMDAMECTGKVDMDVSDTISSIYYDAWENDFWDNAFEPLFDKMLETSVISQEIEKKEMTASIKNAGKIIALTLKGVVKKKLDDWIDSSAIDEIINETKNMKDILWDDKTYAETIFPEYKCFQKAIDLLQQELKDAVQKNRGQLVVIIDELDRCKPTFAVQTLEIVKHLFNIEGLIFIFALDIHQLSHCVKSVYGEGIDAEGYLERFFNYISILPQANFETIVDHCFKEVGMDDTNEVEKNGIKQIARSYGLSLRDFRTVFCSYAILDKTVLRKYKNIQDARVLYFYFLTIKYKYPNIYVKAILQNDRKQLGELMKEHPIPYNGIAASLISEDLREELLLGEKIGDTNFKIINGGQTGQNKMVLKYSGNRILFKDGTADIVDEKYSLSNVLFFPDLIRYEEIKEYTLFEYIYQNLEMVDFVEEA